MSDTVASQHRSTTAPLVAPTSLSTEIPCAASLRTKAHTYVPPSPDIAKIIRGITNRSDNGRTFTYERMTGYDTNAEIKKEWNQVIKTLRQKGYTCKIIKGTSVNTQLKIMWDGDEHKEITDALKHHNESTSVEEVSIPLPDGVSGDVVARERIKTSYTTRVLDVSRLGLTELPPLYDNLQILICDHNKITAFPRALPPSLKVLSCCNNLLTELPPIPKNVQVITATNNPLRFTQEEYGCAGMVRKWREWHKSIGEEVAPISKKRTKRFATTTLPFIHFSEPNGLTVKFDNQNIEKIYAPFEYDVLTCNGTFSSEHGVFDFSKIGEPEVWIMKAAVDDNTYEIGSGLNTAKVQFFIKPKFVPLSDVGKRFIADCLSGKLQLFAVYSYME